MEQSSVKEWIKLIGSMIIIGVLLLYIIFQLFIPELTVKVFGFKPYVVVTESMEPEILVNDMVFVRDFDAEEAEVGDIITFNADINYDGTQEVVTHYIYSIGYNGESYIIRTNRYYENEAEAVPDTWILSEDAVLGSYWFHIPRIGYVTEFLKSPFGIAAMLVNIGVIVGVVYLIKQGKAENKETE